MKIGVALRIGPLAPGAPPPSYAYVREIALRLDQSRVIDSIWLYDHLLYRWPGRPTDGIWECWTILSALAECTQRVELGTMVLCTAFRNPALLAKMAVTLDEISRGRLTLGLGAGWHQPEFDAFGIPFDHRAMRFAEAIAIIAPLVRQGRVDFRGKFYAAPNCEVIPRGPRPSGIPLLLAGSGPRMLKVVAAHADAWNTAWHAEPESVRKPLEQIRDACKSVGRDPATLQVTAAVAVAYPELGGHAWTATYLSGDSPKIADSLRGYAELDISHVIVEITPFSAQAVDRFVQAAETYRGAC
jgi:probable F420-dependent oxidoreductase